MKKIVQTALIASGMINTSLVHHFENAKVHAKKMKFPIGEPNDKFAQYFTGKSFLAPVSTSQVGIFNVTFEPGCRNNWHIHHTKSRGEQILICIAGCGYYQEEGKEAIEMKLGDCIPKNRKRECVNEAQTLVVWAFSNFDRNLRTIIFKKSIINL